MDEKSCIELIRKGDDENFVMKEYETDRIPATDVISACNLMSDDPNNYGLLLITYTLNEVGDTVNERSCLITF